MATLYVVATPIGNLEDISFRAVRVLKEVDLILCEDTRHTKRLLSHYDISTPTKSYNQHSGAAKVDSIVSLLEKGSNIALVSDAGTPGINDPGTMLVADIVRRAGAQIQIVSIPGASAAIAALSISGFPSHEFEYLGFIPHKKGRQTLFEYIADSDRTIVVYESSHRITKTLNSLQELLGPERQIVVCRELTKIHETTYRGSCGSVLEQLAATSTKGEFVIIISPASWA